MLTIRLARVGKKKQAFYRLIVSEKTLDTKGSYVEALGSLNPHTNPPAANLKADRIKYWLEHGASLSPRVHNLLIDHKLIDGEKVKAWWPKKKKEEEKKEEAKTEAVPKTKPEDKIEEVKETKAEAKTETKSEPTNEEKPDEAKSETSTETPEETKKKEVKPEA
ncbi:MAG: 30S ribosomal protein S16 [Patescibacteria group bacterium]